MDHPFYVTDTEGEVIPVKQFQLHCAIPFGFRIFEDEKTFIGISCNRRDPVHIYNAIQELRAELAKYGYSVIPGYAPEDNSQSSASGMFGGEVLG